MKTEEEFSEQSKFCILNDEIFDYNSEEEKQ